MSSFDIQFDFRRLKRDLKIEIPALPELFKRYFDVKLETGSIYAWFERGSMPLERLAQLFMITAFEQDKKLDFWSYVLPIRKTDAGKSKKAG